METNLVNFGTLALIGLGIAMGAVLLLWLASIPLKDVSIIDMFFALILFAIAAAGFAFGQGASSRKLLVLVLVGAWAARITVHLVRRNWGRGEDPRYTSLRGWVDSDRAFVWLSLHKVFLMQGVVIWLAAFPMLAAMSLPQPATLGWAALAGVLVWLLGFLLETIADLQLTRFRADPANRGTVLRTGLWKYSRHPNYFGELCVWWGIFLVACDNPLAIMTVAGPLIYSWLVINVTGQRTLDKKLMHEKPGYADYMATTSGLVPLPPRRKKG